MLDQIFKSLATLLGSELSHKIAFRLLPNVMRNENKNLANPSQLRVLMCYVPIHSVDITKVNHANILHINQMIHYFVKRDCSVDVCYANAKTTDFKAISSNEYDVIIGFGTSFKQMIQSHQIPVKISFITENDPEVVSKKYSQRIDYFMQRHPNVKMAGSVARSGFYDHEQFGLADYGIHMSSTYNSKSLQGCFKKLWNVNANSICNQEFIFVDEEIRKSIPTTKRRLIWFGSVGLIHKGVDIVIDAMRELPDCTCDFYGMADREKSLFNQLKADNTRLMPRIKVQSKQFISEVAMGHCFQIFPSCSEGMSTAVCTCMAVGIIPILTKESGFDPHPGIIFLENDTVECLVETIQRALALPDDEILKMRRSVYEYAKEAFSLEHFDKQFTEIMDEIWEDASLDRLKTFEK